MTQGNEGEQAFLKERRRARLDSYRSSPEDIAAHHSDEGQIQSDYHQRFAFELIQNADDAMAETAGKRTVRFELHDGVLLVANTGRPIVEEDVKALCTMSYTTKRSEEDRRASIGHKGRGFSSVLEITDRPQVFSTGISFEFHEERSREAIASLVAKLDGISMDELPGIPLMRLPFEPEATPERVEQLFNEGYKTVFRFDLKDARVEQDVRATMNSLDRDTALFLRTLKRLELSPERGVEQGWWVARDSRDIESDRTELKFVTVGPLAMEGETNETFALFSRNDIKIGRHTGGIDENTWGDVEYTEVGVATLVEEQEGDIHLRPLSERPNVHVFLPTEEQSPVPLLMNGAFHTAISRTSINVTGESDNYNRFLLGEVAELLATDIRRYCETTATTVEEFLGLLDITHLDEEALARNDRLQGRFAQALRGHLGDTEFIPRVADTDVKESPRQSVRQTILPYYSREQPQIAPKVAALFGPDHLDIEVVEATGWFPQTSLLKPPFPDILKRLGAVPLEPEEVPLVLGEVPNDRARLRWPEHDDELATDPILEPLIDIWRTISGQDDTLQRFTEAANASAVFPVGRPNADIVEHVARDGGVQFFLPPQNELPDVSLSGLRFLTPALYRPQTNVSPSRQSELIKELRPALEDIWGINEYNFERVVEVAVFPKLPVARHDTQADEELRNDEVLELIWRLAGQTVDPANPLPLIERDGTLHRLCHLPVPTRDGEWEPAHRIYLGEEWQAEEPRARQIEPLLEKANIEAPFVASPGSLPGVDASAEETTEEREETIERWRRFFRWLGVARHVRLQPLFDLHANRSFKSTQGIERPGRSSLLDKLSEEDWEAYRTHLQTAMDEAPQERGKYDTIYAVNNIEYFDRLQAAAQRDESVRELLFNHLASWWRDSLSRWQRPVLATHKRSPSFGKRNPACPWESEKREVGQNLWLWQLARCMWLPSNQGPRRPDRTWYPTETVRRRFGLEEEVLLPVLSPTVMETAPAARDMLEALGIRTELTRENFEPEDIENVLSAVARRFGDEDEETLVRWLRRLKPVYRYVSELLPPLDSQGQLKDSTWQSEHVDLQEIEILHQQGEESYGFAPASEVFFVRSPDVLDRIPVEDLPLFILQEEETARFGTHLGLRDLEAEAEAEPKLGEEIATETEQVRKDLEDVAPYLLCRLEAERRSQELITQDINGLRRFIETVTIVDDIEVVYRFNDEREAIRSTPTHFLDTRGKERQKRPTPFILDTIDEMTRDRYLARAICEYLGVNQFEALMTLLGANSNHQRREYLKLAAAPSTQGEIRAKHQELSGEEGPDLPKDESNKEKKWGEEPHEPHERSSEREADDDDPHQGHRGRDRRSPEMYGLDELQIDGDGIVQQIEVEPGTEKDPDGSRRNRREIGGSGGGGPDPLYINDIDELGMHIASKSEEKRLGREDASDYVFKVHTPDAYVTTDQDPIGKEALQWLRDRGIPDGYPGFDILVVDPETNEPQRLIELKSSGHDVRTPGVSWNEWKTASHEGVSERFYLYIVGNLRKDGSGPPYLKTIRNPFELLNRETRKRRSVEREVKVDVTSFRQDGELTEYSLL